MFHSAAKHPGNSEINGAKPCIAGGKLRFFFDGCDGLRDDKRVNAAIDLATLRIDDYTDMSDRSF